VSPHTYGQRLGYGIIRLVAELRKAYELPLPLHELRSRFLDMMNIDPNSLSRNQKEAFKRRFTKAIDNMEGSILESEHRLNERKISTRYINYKEIPFANGDQIQD